MASTSNPRVIYATANKVDNNSSGPNTNPGIDDSSLVLTGGELRQAREVLSRNNTNSSSTAVPTTSVISIPKVPSSAPGLPPQALVTKPSQIKPLEPKNETGGDVEVANLLLNMGGASNDKKSLTDKTIVGSPSTASKPASQVPPSDTSELQDGYLQNWVGGSISLHTPEDDDVLSPLHCFMRRYCVEAFSAEPEDVATPRYGKSHGFKVEVGQVGIRCLHCKHLPHGQRAERAVCYPSSLRNIYHSIETWQRRHSLVCKHITPWVRKSIMELMESSKTRAGGRRQYWEDSARRLGMVDTSRGVRFARKPGDHGPLPTQIGYSLPGTPDAPGHRPQPVVRPSDQGLVTDYLFLLMDQMQTCRFTEADRTGGRSKIKDNEVGFPGMECRHCQGRAGFGRYFPSSVAALSLANSDRNVYNHLRKCRRCPEDTKKELIQLHKTQNQSKNRRGLRKIFFHRIWKRIHGPEDDTEDENEIVKKVAKAVIATTTPQLPVVPHFVPYAGMAPSISSEGTPSIMGLGYHPSVRSRVAVHKFRGY